MLKITCGKLYFSVDLIVLLLLTVTIHIDLMGCTKCTFNK